MAGNHKMIQVLMRICATLWDEKRVIVDNRFCYISCYIYIISRNISYSSSSGEETQCITSLLTSLLTVIFLFAKIFEC